MPKTARRRAPHPEHKEMLGWIGGAFDPERFDLKGINQALARVGKRSKR